MLVSKPTALAILLAVAAGCREKAGATSGNEPSTRPEPSAERPPAKPPEPARCRELAPGSLFPVGEDSGATPRAGEEEEGDEALTMPYAAEIGGAVGLGGGFAVSVLTSQKQGQRVSLVLLSEGGSGRLVEIGTVHGDVDAPAVTAVGDRAVVLFGDSDAAGATLRTAVVARDGEKAVRGPELVDVERDAGAALGSLGDAAVVAFSRAPKGKPELLTARFRPGEPLGKPETVALQAAESPELAMRPGGAWLGWIEQHPLPKAQARDAGDDEEPGGIDLGPRSLRVAKLDKAGKPLGTPLALTGDDSHVLAFELSPWANGGVLVAWRDDPAAAPGVEGGALHVAHVKPDGTVERSELGLELGAGVPGLLYDAAPRSPGQLVWLAAGGGTEATRFGLVTGSGTSVTELSADRTLGTAELVAVHGGRLLAARPRRTAQDLFLLECSIRP
jgi:hypothetical protein